MEKILKLYTYVDGTNDTPFPSSEEQIIIGSFTYTANRMGSSPAISATVKHRLCLDDLWNDKVYAEFNGEKYFVINTPSSSKSNDDTRYEHDLELLSEREVLNHVYFIDAVQGDSDVDQYKSNSTKVQFYGNLEQFVGRLNASLSYRNLGYSAVIDDGISTEDKNVTFEDKYILEALQEEFNAFEIPYYFVGKVIHFGYTANTITTPFKYGYDSALLSISKDNANYALINRITGTGSSDNIPYYYPNNSPKGDLGIKIISGNMVKSNFIITDYDKFSNSMSLTDVCKCTSVSDGGITSFKWSIGDNDILLSDIGIKLAENAVPQNGASFGQEVLSYITPSQNLMPSIYRETGGAERFYNAKNNTYTDGEGGYYQFENEYSDSNPREGITDFEEIKPTIVGVTNSAGHRIDSFIDFAYDTNDNDEVDENGEYLHPYFFAKLRKTDGAYGFNLFDQAIENQAMQISFTSGVCGACAFEIAVGDETQKNLVQVGGSGALMRDENGNVLCGRKDLQQPQIPQDRQNDTQNYEVWIALRKDSTTYPQVMPNVNYNYKPSTSDTFVILGINLPQAYILKAEDELEKSLIKYMWMNNVEKFTFSAKFSRIFFEENPDILLQLNENSRVLIEYNGRQHTLYIDNYTYKMDSGSPLPEIDVDLVDTLTIGKNSLQAQLDSVKQDILSSIGGGDFLKQGLKYFLRKDQPDETKYLIKFLGGLISDNIESQSFSSGPFGTGFVVKRDPKTGKSYIETDELYVRLKAYFETLEIKHLSHVGGRIVASPAGMECVRVELVSAEYETLYDSTGSPITDSEGEEVTVPTIGGEQAYRCYFKQTDGEKEIVNEFAVDDLAQCREFNVKEGTSHQVSNQYYWRRVIGVGEDYIDLSITDCDPGSMEPKAGDTIVTIGNKTDESRQHVVFLSSYDNDAPCIKLYSGINSYSMLDKEVTVISPNADKNVFTGKVVIKPGSTGYENLADAPDMTEINREIQNAKDDAASASQAASEVQQSVADLTGYVDGAFSDGIISESEAKAIATYINVVNNEKKSAEAVYDELYNNPYLEGSAKVGLANAKSAMFSAADALINSVNTAIADGKATQGEKADVDAKYASFNTECASFNEAVKAAEKSIQDKLKGYADNAQMAADEANQAASNAQEDANEAKQSVESLNTYVDGAFKDGIITESEAKAIATYINTVNSTKGSMDSTYTALYSNSYLTGTYKSLLYSAKRSFDSAVASLTSSINTAIADGKTTESEKNTVDTRFASFNDAYASLSTAIENANKAIQDKIKQEAADQAKEDIDAQIGEVDLSVKNEIAKQLGYTDYENLKYYAERGMSIISGGTINTEVLEASLVITSQLIANAIRTNTLNVNNKFKVYTDGSVSMQGEFSNENSFSKLLMSNGFIRIMSDLEDSIGGDGFESVRLSVNDEGIPELILRTGTPLTKIVTISPSGITFYRAGDGVHGEINLTIDPLVIGDGVIKKTSDGMLYISEDSIAKYKLTIKTSGGGSTYPSTGVNYVNQGETIFVNAYPDSGYEFDKWSDGGAKSHSVTINRDNYELTAYFREIKETTYTVTLKVSPSGSGSVSGGGTYEQGTRRTVSATANSGWRFVRWSDGGYQRHTVTWDANKTLTAYFEKYSVTGNEIFSGTELTSSAYWMAYGTDSVKSVTGGIATLTFTGSTSGNDYISFNKGYLGSKLEQGHKYRLEIEAKSSVNGAYLIGLIGPALDSGESINGDAIFYGDALGDGTLTTSYKTLTAEFTATRRDSTSADGFLFTVLANCTVTIRSISLKEV